jgi:hypothetical protein
MEWGIGESTYSMKMHVRKSRVGMALLGHEIIARLYTASDYHRCFAFTPFS